MTKAVTESESIVSTKPRERQINDTYQDLGEAKETYLSFPKYILNKKKFRAPIKSLIAGAREIAQQ